MRIFDLHCDTATVLYDRGLPFDNRETQIRKNLLDGIELTQCFAVFLNDTLPHPPGLGYVRNVKKAVFPSLPETVTPLLTVEGAGVLAAEDGWIDALRGLNCRMAGLCWNGENPLGTGAVKDDSAPLKPAGKEAVCALWDAGIFTDVSHLSAAGVEDVLSAGDFPIAASHSDSRSVWDHPRNLTDDAAKEIFRRGGAVGLNLYPPFLGQTADFAAILRHADRFLALGGERGLCLGCDLDGVSSLPEGMRDLSSLSLLYARMKEAFGETLCNAIFYDNAARFFAR